MLQDRKPTFIALTRRRLEFPLLLDYLGSSTEQQFRGTGGLRQTSFMFTLPVFERETCLLPRHLFTIALSARSLYYSLTSVLVLLPKVTRLLSTPFLPNISTPGEFCLINIYYHSRFTRAAIEQRYNNIFVIPKLNIIVEL